MLTHIDVAKHTGLVPAEWKPGVQAVTSQPYVGPIDYVEIMMDGLGSTIYDMPVITIAEGSRGAYHWKATVGSTVAGQDTEFAVADAVSAGVHAIQEARMSLAEVA